jgi:hypothetical protein
MYVDCVFVNNAQGKGCAFFLGKGECLYVGIVCACRQYRENCVLENFVKEVSLPVPQLFKGRRFTLTVFYLPFV